MKQTNIIDAIKNRKIFGSLPRFKKLDSWTAWIIVLKAIFGLPLDADEWVIFNRHTGRTRPPAGGAKEVYLVVGRRGGKSFMSALIAAFIACFGDFSRYATPGETLAVLCLAIDKPQARIVFRYLKAIINAIPVLKNMVVAEHVDEIELTNGVTIMVKASDFGGVRGPTVVAVIVDELDFWPNQGVNPDKEILSALRPAMATIPSAKMIFISTGYAQVGALFDAHKQHYGKDGDDEILVWQADTHAMNPSISQEFIDKEIARDPEAGRAEWLGLFREDVTAAFPLELIERCIIPGRAELFPSPGFSYNSFDDPSGGRGDAWAKAITHVNADGKVVIDCVRWWKAPFDPSVITKETADLGKLYGCQHTVGDNYGGEWPKAEFAKHGVSYQLSEKNKSELYLALIPQLTSGKVELLDCKELKNEMKNLERRRGRSGKDSIDHLPRLHDDIANSVAGAVFIASQGAGSSIDQFLENNRDIPNDSIMATGEAVFDVFLTDRRRGGGTPDIW